MEDGRAADERLMALARKCEKLEEKVSALEFVIVELLRMNYALAKVPEGEEQQRAKMMLAIAKRWKPTNTPSKPPEMEVQRLLKQAKEYREFFYAEAYPPWRDRP